MSVAVGMMVKDEGDILDFTLRHLVEQGVARIYVLDNLSRDNTAAIVKRQGAPWEDLVQYMRDFEVGYYQSQKMTDLLGEARDDGFDWFVPVDADEWWCTGPQIVSFTETLEMMPRTIQAVRALLYDYRPTGEDRIATSPFERMQWRDAMPGSLPKMAVRTNVPGAVIQMGNHGIEGLTNERLGEGLWVRHYPYRSEEQFVSKARNGAAAYAAAPDLDEKYGVHWKAYGDILEKWGEDGLRSWYRQHFFHADPLEAGLVWDPAVVDVYA